MIVCAFILILAIFPFPQTEDHFYIESWKKGKQQIQQQSFKITLTSKERKYETKIMDASGKERYRLSVRLCENQGQPPTGFVELVEKSLFGFQDTNLLKPSNDPYQDYFTEKDFVAVLDPLVDGWRCQSWAAKCAPYLVKRIIKVKGFYCVLQVTNFNQSPVSMTVTIEFVNTVGN
jgi:hypothetical protein